MDLVDCPCFPAKCLVGSWPVSFCPRWLLVLRCVMLRKAIMPLVCYWWVVLQSPVSSSLFRWPFRLHADCDKVSVKSHALVTHEQGTAQRSCSRVGRKQGLFPSGWRGCLSSPWHGSGCSYVHFRAARTWGWAACSYRLRGWLSLRAILAGSGPLILLVLAGLVATVPAIYILCVQLDLGPTRKDC